MTIDRLPFSDCLDYPIYSFIVISQLLGILPLKISTTKTKCFENDSKTRFQIQADEKITCSAYIEPWCIISRLAFFFFWFLIRITYSQMFLSTKSTYCENLLAAMVILYNDGHEFAFVFTDKYVELFNILSSIPYRSRENSKPMWKIYVVRVFWVMIPTVHIFAIIFTYIYCLLSGILDCSGNPSTLPFTFMITWALLLYKISLKLMMNALTLDDIFDNNSPINEKVIQDTREMLQKVSEI